VTKPGADTVIAIYSWSFDPYNPGANVIGFNDDGGPASPNSEVTVTLSNGQTVAIMASTFSSGDSITPSTIYSKGLGTLSA
jgi:hypothetical protein